MLQDVQPDEVYNLAAQSRNAVSSEEPECTADADRLGTLRLLEAVRIPGRTERMRFYQASTFQLDDQLQEALQSETTPFSPRSSYAGPSCMHTGLP